MRACVHVCVFTVHCMFVLKFCMCMCGYVHVGVCARDPGRAGVGPTAMAMMVHVPCVTPAYECLHTHLQFEGVEISLDDRMGIFITMNPGYAGRTELPESVKALFRPVVVIVPDLEQICEIMLFSEGFLNAKVCWYCLYLF